MFKLYLLQDFILTLFCISLLLTSCGDTGAPQSTKADSSAIAVDSPQPPTHNSPTKAERILARAVDAHGGEAYERAHYQFVFRGKTFTFQNQGTKFAYTLEHEKDGRHITDMLTNESFLRKVDGKKVKLNAKETASGKEGVNSVIYFATLPHKLTDPAVNLTFAGRETILDKEYDVLDVNFDEQGGGTDHDDNFRYWVNRQTDRIDYLAYDYRTNGGGVRFRSAYHPRIVDGILFQDYVNYKAPLGTPLAELPKLFAAGELEELSRIETEEVKAL